MKIFYPFLLLAFLILSSCSTGPTKTELRKAAESNAELGANYLGSGFLRKAKGKLEKALDQDPNNAKALGTYALLLSKIDKDEEAQLYFSKALKITPEDSKLLNNYGIYLCRMGKINLAEKSFLKSIENKLYETPQFALLNAGICLLKDMQYSVASNYFTQAINVKHKYADGYYYRAKSFYLAKQYQDAELDILKYHDIVKENAPGLLLGYKISLKTNNRLMKNEYAFKLKYRFPESNETKFLINQ